MKFNKIINGSTDRVAILIILLTKFIHYLYPLADNNSFYLYIMNTFCRWGLVWMFLIAGFLGGFVLKDADIYVYGKKLIKIYFIWSIIYCIYNISKWYLSEALSMKHILKYVYGIVLGEPAFIWCIYGIGLSYIIISIYNKKHYKWSSLIFVAVALLLAFMYLNIYRKFIFMDETNIYRLFLKVFRTARNPLAFSLIFVLFGYGSSKITEIREHICQLNTKLLVSLILICFMFGVIEIKLIYTFTNNYNLHLTVFNTLSSICTYLLWLKLVIYNRNAGKLKKLYIKKNNLLFYQNYFLSSLISLEVVTQIFKKFNNFVLNYILDIFISYYLCKIFTNFIEKLVKQLKYGAINTI